MIETNTPLGLVEYPSPVISQVSKELEGFSEACTGLYSSTTTVPMSRSPITSDGSTILFAPELMQPDIPYPFRFLDAHMVAIMEEGKLAVYYFPR